MDSKQFAQLASQAQAGDKASLEQLLVLAYTPVSYQCRKLLQNNQAAADMTKKILQRIPDQLHTLKQPELFEKWLGSLTARYCMGALRRQTEKKNPPPKKPDLHDSNLDPQETALVVDQIVDSLPDDLRICIALYCCCNLPVSGIARLTGFAESDVQAHLARGQARIKGQLQKLHQQGVRFASVGPLPGMLQTAMYASGNSKAASAMVHSILVMQAAAPVPMRSQTALGLKLAVAAVSALLVLMGGLIFFLERNRQAELEMEPTAVTSETETQPTETTVATTAETTPETTMETTAETTVETTAETTEATTEATTQPATEPAPKAQQTQGSQTVSGNTTSATGSNAPSTGGQTASSGNGNHVHSYQDAGPIGVNPAGCESPGSRLKICFVCGDQVRYVDEVGLPPHGHSYSSKVRAPTEGSEGFTIHTCTRCGKTYMDNYVPKLPPATQAVPEPEPEVTPDVTPDPVPEPAPEAPPDAAPEGE